LSKGRYLGEKKLLSSIKAGASAGGKPALVRGAEGRGEREHDFRQNFIKKRGKRRGGQRMLEFGG